MKAWEDLFWPPIPRCLDRATNDCPAVSLSPPIADGSPAQPACRQYVVAGLSARHRRTTHQHAGGVRETRGVHRVRRPRRAIPSRPGPTGCSGKPSRIAQAEPPIMRDELGNRQRCPVKWMLSNEPSREGTSGSFIERRRGPAAAMSPPRRRATRFAPASCLRRRARVELHPA